MQMNPSIILSGQTPDPVGSMARGAQAASGINQVRRQNNLANLYQEQGAGLLSGDQNALNALAGLDPTQALGMQQTHQAMDIAGNSEDRAAQAFKMELKEATARMSAAEAAAAKQNLEGLLREAAVLYANGDREGFANLAQQSGIQIEFDQFPQKAMSMGADMWDALTEAEKRNAPAEPADEYGRYVQEEAAAGRTPLGRIDYAKAKQKSSRLVVGKDGSVTLSEGAAASGAMPDMTVDEAKNAGFLIRTRDANEILNQLENEGLNFGQQNADALPLGTGNYLRSENFQKFDQARRDFVNAILRRESGAVISTEEFENANVQYFPVPGDGPEVIKQKRQNRINAIEGLRVGSGEGAAYVDSMEKPKANEAPATAPEGVDPDAWEFMTDEEKALFQ